MPTIPRPNLVQFPRPWRGIPRCKAAIGLPASSVTRLYQRMGPPRWRCESITTRNGFSTSAVLSQKLEETSDLSGNERRDLSLDGITVVSLEQAIAAPLCTRHLADHGARVIKIERRDGGDFARGYDTRVRGSSAHFVWVNRSKESLALDIKDPEDFAVLKKLITSKADVLVQNLAPGAANRLGLSYEALRKTNPGLIVCNISGYGTDGPMTTKKAYDLLIQSEAGVLSVTGTETEPVKVGISVADISAGMYAYSNILSALLKRNKTGKGREIDISMLESLVEWMGFPLYYTIDDAPGPKPVGTAHAAVYPYGPFETGSDGKESVMLGVQNEREWANFCVKVLQQPALVSDERFSSNTLRVENRERLKEIIRENFSAFTAEDVLKKLDAAGIANAKVNDMRGVWRHEQLKARGRWTEIDTPSGCVPALLPPGFSNVFDARMDAVPSLGQHNKSILAELGFHKA